MRELNKTPPEYRLTLLQHEDQIIADLYERLRQWRGWMQEPKHLLHERSGTVRGKRDLGGNAAR